MANIEKLCALVVNHDDYDGSDVYELAEATLKLLAKHRRLSLRFKKVKSERDSLLLKVKPRTPGFMKNRDQSDEG